MGQSGREQHGRTSRVTKLAIAAATTAAAAAAVTAASGQQWVPATLAAIATLAATGAAAAVMHWGPERPRTPPAEKEAGDNDMPSAAPEGPPTEERDPGIPARIAVAHELTNPLNLITNFAEGALEAARELRETPGDDDTGDPAESAETIERALERLLIHAARAQSLITEILTRPDGATNRSTVDLNELTREATTVAYLAYRVTNQSFSMNISWKLDRDRPMTTANPHDLERLIINTVTNACQAMAQKAETDPEYRPELTMGTATADTTVTLKVRDNGPGMEEETLSKAFDAHYTTKAPGIGGGLGLALCREIVAAQGGTITAKSAPGAGTTITVTLDRQTDSQDNAQCDC